MPRHFLFWILVLLLAAFAIMQCDDVTVWKSPSSLVGSYSGVYSRVVEGSDSGKAQFMLWTFSSDKFFMSCDPSHYPSKDTSDGCFAECTGAYSKTNNTVALEIPGTSPDSNKTGRICSGPYAVYGTYQYADSNPGEIDLTSLTTNPQGITVTRLIRLFRDSANVDHSRHKVFAPGDKTP